MSSLRSRFPQPWALRNTLRQSCGEEATNEFISHYIRLFEFADALECERFGHTERLKQLEVENNFMIEFINRHMNSIGDYDE